MVKGTLYREPTAHVESTLTFYAAGSRQLMIEKAHDGEDVPIRVDYVDDAGADIDPDAAPTITITDEAGTDVVSAVSMTTVSVGTWEHVWDSATNGSGTGTYEVSVTAEFSAETKIDDEDIDLYA